MELLSHLAYPVVGPKKGRVVAGEFLSGGGEAVSIGGAESEGSEACGGEIIFPGDSNVSEESEKDDGDGLAGSRAGPEILGVETK